ncbi:putative assembly protein [mine drainage metagenome]|uniref:Putative assembly protein n=1 Tax=mine drainage metagenome TaxID=410659 RepID=A0A1J5T1C7_9ZZZZ
MRPALIAKLLLLGVMALAVTLVAVAKSINVAAYRPLLVQAVRQATGRDLVIKGRLSLRLSLNPALVAHDVELSNRSGGSAPVMLRVEKVEADIGLVALLGRHVSIRHLILHDADLLLERDGAGRDNWSFDGHPVTADPSSGGTPTQLDLSQLTIVQGTITYHDARRGPDQHIQLEQFSLDAPIPGAPVGLLSTGTWDGKRFDLSGTLGSAGAFNDFVARTGRKTFPLKLKAVLPGLIMTADGTVSSGRGGPRLAVGLSADSADLAASGRLIGLDLPPLGAARMTVTLNGPLFDPRLDDIDAVLGRRDAGSLAIKGTVADPRRFTGVDLRLLADGDSLAAFTRALGYPLPAMGGMKASARIRDQQGGWVLQNVALALGHSDLTGEVTLRGGLAHPAVEARLTSAVFDAGELLGVAAPAVPVAAGGGRALPLFSDSPLPLNLLHWGDLDLVWSIGRLSDGLFLAQSVRLAATLTGGRLSLQAAAAQAANGTLRGDLTVDGAPSPPRVEVSLAADKVDLGQLLHDLRLSDLLQGGQTDYRLRLKGGGRSLHAIMASATGESLLVMGAGQLAGGPQAPAPAPGAEASAESGLSSMGLLHQIAPWAPDGDGALRCLVSDFILSDGLAKSDVLLADTPALTLVGQGSVNLGTETLDLTLVPRPKDRSLLPIALPVDVRGDLTRPLIGANQGTLVRGTGGLAGLPGSPAVPLPEAAGVGNACLEAVVAARHAPPQHPGKGRKRIVKAPILPRVSELMQELIGK